MLDLRRLRLLRGLKRLATITALAEAANYSPSGVSQQLSTLAQEAGVTLLEPAGRRVRLTPQADVLVEHTARLLAEMERTEVALARSLHDTVGTLRVSTPSGPRWSRSCRRHCHGSSANSPHCGSR